MKAGTYVTQSARSHRVVYWDTHQNNVSMTLQTLISSYCNRDCKGVPGASHSQPTSLLPAVSKFVATTNITCQCPSSREFSHPSLHLSPPAHIEHIAHLTHHRALPSLKRPCRISAKTSLAAPLAATNPLPHPNGSSLSTKDPTDQPMKTLCAPLT